MKRIGRYQIEGEIGRGAMGVVHRGFDPTIGRTIAIKTISLSDVNDPDELSRLLDRLFREAQSAGVLSHPNIVTIFDVVEEDGMAYVFMELVDGPSLGEALATDPMPPKGALIQYLRQIAAGLDHAHRKGIIHRDVKPGNVLIHERETAKIADFGLAKILSQQMTRTGGLLGTPNYMSPEHIQGMELSGATDQFALGVIAYEILTGQRPFEADSLPALLFKICRDEFAALRSVNPSLPEDVEPVFQRVLAKDPEERYATCTQFVDDLVQALASRPEWLATAPAAEAPRRQSNPPPPPPPAPKPPSARPAASSQQPELTAPPAAFSLPPSQSPALPAFLSNPMPQAARPQPPPTAALLAPLPAALSASPPAVASPIAVRKSVPPPASVGPRKNSRIVAMAVVSCLALVGAAAFGLVKMGVFERKAPKAAVVQAAPVAEAPAVEQPVSPPPAVVAATPTPPVLVVRETPPVATPKPEPKARTGPDGPTNAQELNSAGPSGSVVRASSSKVKQEAPKPAKPAVETRALAGILRIDSVPPGATVSIGELLCITPCALVPGPGSHALLARLDGYRNVQRNVDPAREPSVSIELKRLLGVLKLSSNPSGATIVIDGKVRPEKTPTMLQLPAGSYRLQVISGDVKAEEKIVIHDSVLTERAFTLQ